MDDNRHAQAAGILEELHAEWPAEHRFGVQLAMCFQALDRIADLRSVMEDLSTRRKAEAEHARVELRQLVVQLRERRDQQAADPSAPDEPLLKEDERIRYRELRAHAHYNPHAIEYLWGYVALAEADYQRALEHLHRAESHDPTRPGLHLQIGEAYLKLRRADDAERSFQQPPALIRKTRMPNWGSVAFVCCVDRIDARQRRHFGRSDCCISFRWLITAWELLCTEWDGCRLQSMRC